MPRDYDLGIIVNPDVGDEQARAIVERITQVIATHEGQVVRVNAVGRRRLAYPIDHHRDGLYFYFDLIVEPQSIAEIERTLRVNEEIIRHLLLGRDPRVVAQQREREAQAQAQAQAQAAERAAMEVESAESGSSAPVADETDLEESETDESDVEEAEAEEAEAEEAEAEEAEAEEAEAEEAEAEEAEAEEAEADESDVDEPEVEAESETETEA